MRGATPEIVIPHVEIYISIHAPHEGSDLDAVNQRETFELFQSTLPMRGATAAQSGLHGVIGISIHAPHEGSDSKTVQKTDACFVINRNFAKLNSQGSTWLAC